MLKNYSSLKEKNREKETLKIRFFCFKLKWQEQENVKIIFFYISVQILDAHLQLKIIKIHNHFPQKIS